MLNKVISSLTGYYGKRTSNNYIGAFIYAIIVKPLGHFSGWAGAVALGIIMIPAVLRITENMLSLIPLDIEGDCFSPYYKVIIQVVYRDTATGILTGIIFAIARVTGKIAALLFNVFNNNYFG